jgi:hypothetical protein
LNGIRSDLDCQAPPITGAGAGGDGETGGESFRGRTHTTQALEPGHWECGECLKNALASVDNMICKTKTKTLTFQFKPMIDYNDVEKSRIDVLHFDDAFKCQAMETKLPFSYDTPVANQYSRNAEYVGVENKVGLCICPDKSEYLVGVYMTNNTLACHNY